MIKLCQKLGRSAAHERAHPRVLGSQINAKRMKNQREKCSQREIEDVQIEEKRPVSKVTGPQAYELFEVFALKDQLQLADS